MKKINVLSIVVFSVIFFSCGKKEGNKDAVNATVKKEDVKKEVANDCGSNEFTLTDEYVRINPLSKEHKKEEMI